MVSKAIGIMLGIALANHIGSSMPSALASFSVVTWIHMYCNLKSYQSIELRTFNPYRASKSPLSFSSFLPFFYLFSFFSPLIKNVLALVSLHFNLIILMGRFAQCMKSLFDP